MDQVVHGAMAERPPWPWLTAQPLRPELCSPPKKILGENFGSRSPSWAGRGNNSSLWAGFGDWSPFWARLGIWGPFWARHETNSPSWAERGFRGPLRVRLRNRFHRGNKRSSLHLKNPYGQDKTDQNCSRGQDKTYGQGFKGHDMTLESSCTGANSGAGADSLFPSQTPPLAWGEGYCCCRHRAWQRRGRRACGSHSQRAWLQNGRQTWLRSGWRAWLRHSRQA